MRYDIMVELRSLVNPAIILQWDQLYDTLDAKGAAPDILEDIAEVLLNLKDILLVLDGKAG